MRLELGILNGTNGGDRNVLSFVPSLNTKGRSAGFQFEKRGNPSEAP